VPGVSSEGLNEETETAQLAEFGKPGTASGMKVLSIEGDFAYCIWTAETVDNVYELGTARESAHDFRQKEGGIASGIAVV
jgi:hypothetical protein